MWQKKGRCLGGKRFGEGEEKEEGRDLLVTCLLFLYHEGCQGSSVCLDVAEKLLYSNPELIGHK